MHGDTHGKGTMANLGTMAALVISAVLFCVLGASGATSPPKKSPQGAQLEKTYGLLPLYFVENRGQVDPRVKYYQKGAGETIFFTPEGVCFSLRGGKAQAGTAGSSAPPSLEQSRAEIRPAPASNQPPPALVQLTPLGMQAQVEIVPANPQEARFNYFLGNDPQKWHTNVPSYGAVVYREAYPGIDLKFYGAARQLEYDIIVKPGADPNLVQFRYAGIKSLEVTPGGDLAIKLPDGGELLQKKPVVYQDIAGVRVARVGKFKVGPETAGHVYGFEVIAYDKSAPLIIDPVLVYSSYLGGSNEDKGTTIAVDQSGCAYVAGRTKSENLATPGAYQPFMNGTSFDAFVAKVNAEGSALVFLTYFGGSSDDYANGLAVGADGSVYIAGYTTSADFPRYHYLVDQSIGTSTAFVTQFTAAGNSLVYSTFLGGNGTVAAAIAADGSGNVYLVGYTGSNDFPVTAGAYQTARGGYVDAFFTKLAHDTRHVVSTNPPIFIYYPDILISTYLGGQDWDQGVAIALGGSSGKIYIAGITDSPNFPAEKAYSAAHGNGLSDAFVVCFDSTGALFFSTCLGGTDTDEAYGVAVDQEENFYVTGSTRSTDFPVKNAFQSNHGGAYQDAFVTKFRPPFYINYPGGSGYWLPVALDYSTYLGGTSNDNGWGIAVDSQGCAYVAGDMFYIEQKVVAKLAADGKTVTYFPPLGFVSCSAIALNSARNIYVTGSNYGQLIPWNPFQAIYGGSGDAFVAKFKQSSLPPLMLLLND